MSLVELARPDSEFAAAKINLTLRILGRRPDGFHELRSIVAFADVGDGLTIDWERPAGLSVTGPFASVIVGENLIAKALGILADEHSQLRLGHVTLRKALPVAAGIGGGSADAAALLRLIAKGNAELAAEIDWQALALRLGADVLVCMASRPARMSGLGEEVAAFEQFPEMPILLANPQIPVPADKTRQIFARLNAPALDSASEGGEGAGGASTAGRETLQRLTFGEALAEMEAEGNDLQRVCFDLLPEVGEVFAELNKSKGRRFAGMSGAGPTCFAVFDSLADAAAAADWISDHRPGWWVRAATLAGAQM